MKPTNTLKNLDHLKLTKQQMITLKGGDDDYFVNTGPHTIDINFTG